MSYPTHQDIDTHIEEVQKKSLFNRYITKAKHRFKSTSERKLKKHSTFWQRLWYGKSQQYSYFQHDGQTYIVTRQIFQNSPKTEDLDILKQHPRVTIKVGFNQDNTPITIKTIHLVQINDPEDVKYTEEYEEYIKEQTIGLKTAYNYFKKKDIKILPHETFIMRSASESTTKLHIFDYYGGTNLRSLMQNKSISRIQKMDMLLQYLEIIRKLGKDNYVHRDPKLDNAVALKQPDGSYKVRLIDFEFFRKCSTEGTYTHQKHCGGWIPFNIPYYRKQQKEYIWNSTTDLFYLASDISAALKYIFPLNSDNNSSNEQKMAESLNDICKCIMNAKEVVTADNPAPRFTEEENEEIDKKLIASREVSDESPFEVFDKAKFIVDALKESILHGIDEYIEYKKIKNCTYFFNSLSEGIKRAQRLREAIQNQGDLTDIQNTLKKSFQSYSFSSSGTTSNSLIAFLLQEEVVCNIFNFNSKNQNIPMFSYARTDASIFARKKSHEATAFRKLAKLSFLGKQPTSKESPYYCVTRPVSRYK